MNLLQAIAYTIHNLTTNPFRSVTPPSTAPKVIFNGNPNYQFHQSPTPSTPPAPAQTPQPTTQTAPSTTNPYFQNFMSNVSKMTKGTPKPLALPNDLKSAINTASTKYGIPFPVLAAISHQETGFQNIPQHAGGLGRGYFQIDLGQHPDVTEAQAMDPNFAADYASKLLLNRVNKYAKTKTPVVNALRAYNGGITNPKTKAYSDSVLNKLQQYAFQ